MKRRHVTFRGLAAAVAASSVLAGAAAIAGAAPEDGANETCTFVVSTPQSAVLPGPGNATGVTATLTWKSCVGRAFPSYSILCVNSATKNGQCTKRVGWDTPFAIFPTQHPTGPFTAQATGCYKTPSLPELVCETRQQSVTL